MIWKCLHWIGHELKLTVFSRVIVSVGGRYVDIYSHIEVYSFQSNKWTGYESEQTGLNNRLMRVCQFTHEENLYFLGGNYITSVSQNIYLFNPGNVTVTLVGALRQPMICDVTIFFNVWNNKQHQLLHWPKSNRQMWHDLVTDSFCLCSVSNAQGIASHLFSPLVLFIISM